MAPIPQYDFRVEHLTRKIKEEFKIGQAIRNGSEAHIITGKSETGKPMVTINILNNKIDIRIDNYKEFIIK